MRHAALLLIIAAGCDFLGLCPSDPCSNTSVCPDEHTCVQGQCVLLCDDDAECPVEARCHAPPMAFGLTMCVDDDGVPGQLCEPDPPQPASG